MDIVHPSAVIGTNSWGSARSLRPVTAKSSEIRNDNHFKGKDNPLLLRCTENASLFSAIMGLRQRPTRGAALDPARELRPVGLRPLTHDALHHNWTIRP